MGKRSILPRSDLVDTHIGQLVSTVVHAGYVLEVLEVEGGTVPFHELFVELVEICRFARQIHMSLYTVERNIVLS